MDPRRFTALVLLSVLAAGCSSSGSRQTSTDEAAPYARSTGLCASPWGDMPTYEQPTPPKSGSMFKAGNGSGLTGTVIVDILVNRDGTVRDVAVVQSSKNADVDATAVAWARSFRYAARIDPDDPAPYVVPQVTLRFSSSEGPGQPVSYPYHVN